MLQDVTNYPKYQNIYSSTWTIQQTSNDGIIIELGLT